jgi:adenylyltransferase and sulfurtransferase
MANPTSCVEENEASVYVVCRLGNDSQIAAEAIRKVRPEMAIKDIIGGLTAWAKKVDASFPVY